MSDITIALDAMGGDHGPKVVVPSALARLKTHKNLRILFVGDEQIIRSELEQHSTKHLQDRFSIVHASQKVEMDDLPTQVLRHKRESSMWKTIEQVKNKSADACVSAGNTGALMVTARYILKTIPGVDRPALIAGFPHPDGITYMLDLGANVNCSAAQLLQFAIMGSLLVSALTKKQNPRVGLLNIGSEQIKGVESVKEAAKLLEAHEVINYSGFVEGDDIYSDKVDLIVCDGFVGNISLKTSEGLVRMVLAAIQHVFQSAWIARLLALPLYSTLKKIKTALDPDRSNGATLLGLQGVVVKSHGGANELAFSYAIRNALLEAEHNLTQRIADNLESILEESSESNKPKDDA